MADDAQHLQDLTDDELAALARRRREDPAGTRALDLLVRRYQRQRLSLAHRYGGGEGADDLAQEAALALVRAVDTHRPEKGPVGPWIWKWMWGATLRAAKKGWSGGRTLRLEEVDAELFEDGSPTVGDGIVGMLVREERFRALASALRQLPDREREAILHSASYRRSTRRTAEAMLRHPAVRPVGDVGLISAGVGDDDCVPPVEHMQGSTWLYRAACRGAPPALFWGRTTTSWRRAAELCGRCTVRRECLLDALMLPPGGGIRAGTSEKERRRLKRST